MKPVELQTARAAVVASDAREHGGQAWRNAWQKEMEGLQAGAWLGYGLVAGQRGGDEAGQAPTQAQAQAHSVPRGRVPDMRYGQQQTAASRPNERVTDPERHRALMQRARAAAVQWLSGPREPASESDVMTGTTGAMAMMVACALPAANVHATARWCAPVPCGERHSPVAAPSFAARAASTAATPDESAGVAQEELAGRRLTLPSSPSDRQAVRFHAEWSALGVRLWLGMDTQAAASAGLLVAQLQRAIVAAGSRLLSITCNGRDVPLASGASPSFPFAEKMETTPWQSTH